MENVIGFGFFHEVKKQTPRMKMRKLFKGLYVNGKKG